VICSDKVEKVFITKMSKMIGFKL